MKTRDAGENLYASPHIIIVALGQEFRRDDAVGIHAIQAWLDLFPDRKEDKEIRIEFAGLPGINLLTLIENFYAAVVVDAMRSGAPAGTIRTIQVSDLATFPNSGTTGHGWGAAESILLGQQIMPEKMPRQLVLIGIEVEDINPGVGLSEKVAAAIPEAAAAIEAYVRNILLHVAESQFDRSKET